MGFIVRALIVGFGQKLGSELAQWMLRKAGARIKKNDGDGSDDETTAVDVIDHDADPASGD